MCVCVCVVCVNSCFEINCYRSFQISEDCQQDLLY